MGDIAPFDPGDNSTDVIIDGQHFNKTALDLFGYLLYPNRTLSNESNCYLVFDPYRPTILYNGTFLHATSCYIPYYDIKTRGALSIGFGVAFGLTLVFTLMNLRKHGRVYLRENKRFRVVGRRWQWYWMCFVAACGMISCFTGIDVDRVYLQTLSIVLQSFFFTLMQSGMLAMVWEATRHWGSFQERQVCEAEPFLLPQNDRRAWTEFWLPLVFYLFAWLDFFMVIPRSWSRLEKQHSPSQTALIAAPSGTEARLKAGGFLAAVAWAVITFSLYHSIKHYKLRSRGSSSSLLNTVPHIPWKLLTTIPLLALRIGYAIASSFSWEINLFNATVPPVYPFSLGYAPCLLILIIYEFAGWSEQNEDRVILLQRRTRGAEVNAELNYVPKPSWWSKASAGLHLSPDERMKALTREMGEEQRAARRTRSEIELGDMSTPETVRNRSKQRSQEHVFTRSIVEAGESRARGTRTENSQPVIRSDVQSAESDAESTRTGMTSTTAVSNMPPQRIRSMLDV